MTGRRLTEGVAPAGLYGGAFAWLTSTVANYALAPWLCGSGLTWLVLAIAAILATVSLAAGLLSWRAWLNSAALAEPGSALARPRHLLAGVAVMSAALFALVILMQGAAVFFLQGCER